MTLRPYSARYAEHYWSPAGGVKEKQVVFLQGSRILERFSGLPAGCDLTVTELGLGTGLNWALTAQQFATVAAPGTRLHYVGHEAYPLPLPELTAIHAALPNNLWPWLNPLQLAWQALQPGWNTVTVDAACLFLWVGEAKHGLLSQPHRADAWFLDGFSPAKNPELWDLALMQQLAAQSKPGATVATYSVARLVRDNLTKVGFQVQKVAGVPPKRDRLIGQLKT